MDTCMTCRFWQGPYNRGQYGANDDDINWGRCRLTDFPEAMMMPRSDDDWGVYLDTRSNFACNQHQPKE